VTETGSDPRSIAGRVAIVTGAASGMGRAIATLFGAQGALVAVVDRNRSGADAVSAGIVEAGGTAIALEVDVGDPDAIVSMVARVRERLGPIDIVVNNAGMVAGATYDQPDFDDVWQATFAVNVDAQQRVVRACLADLERNRDGRVVNIASVEGLGAAPRTAPYTASKHAVVGLTRSMAVDLGRRGVTCNAICPGPINTAMTSAIPDESKQAFVRRRVPVGRYGEPEEVAHVVLMLVQPGASYINGAIIPVDGGMMASNR
jgi:3-oxoacyl-[acyl-carrier protein] reductase